MATVQSILNSVATRINDDADLYGFINMAVRMIAKRLYQMGSSLVIAEMEVPIYAEVTYTASTVAFEVTAPDTITDSASGFVTAGFQVGMYVTTDDALNPGPFKLSGVSAGTLTVVGDSPVLSAVAAGSSITITSVDHYGDLPSDYWGLVDKPYIDGDTSQLEPVPSQNVALGYPSPGVPMYYQMKGMKIYVFPATSSDETIKGDYFASPVELTKKDDELPYNGLCDDIVSEAVILFYSSGAAAKESLREFIAEQLVYIVGQMDMRGPTEFPQGIDWDAATG